MVVNEAPPSQPQALAVRMSRMQRHLDNPYHPPAEQDANKPPSAPLRWRLIPALLVGAIRTLVFGNGIVFLASLCLIHIELWRNDEWIAEQDVGFLVTGSVMCAGLIVGGGLWLVSAVYLWCRKWRSGALCFALGLMTLVATIVVMVLVAA